jgi:hypothetical protein
MHTTFVGFAGHPISFSAHSCADLGVDCDVGNEMLRCNVKVWRDMSRISA